MTKEDRYKDCLIDLISKESVLKASSIQTLPYAVTFVDSLTGKESAHAEMVYHYDNDTWHYTNWNGSVRVLSNKFSEDILNIAQKVYDAFAPRYKVIKTVPLKDCTFF